MHFNTSKDVTYDEATPSLEEMNITTDANQLIAIDTIKIDDHSRFTLTKRIKNVFPVQIGDTIAVYQEKKENNLIFKVQRGSNIVGSWIVRRTTLRDNIDNNTLNNPFYSNNITTGENNTQYKYSSNIMLIDDEKDILLVFKSFLEDKGYTVETFADPREAVSHFVKVNPCYYDLVITDIRMPGLTGVQLYTILKTINTHIKVLFITALNSIAQEIPNILPEVKTNDIIKKPIIKEHFIEKVKSSLKVCGLILSIILQSIWWSSFDWSLGIMNFN
jgi:CheY-like chemotaxis protein